MTELIDERKRDAITKGDQRFRSERVRQCAAFLFSASKKEAKNQIAHQPITRHTPRFARSQDKNTTGSVCQPVKKKARNGPMSDVPLEDPLVV